jgi:hypothetical protein
LVGAYTATSYNAAASADLCSNLVTNSPVATANTFQGLTGACGSGTFNWSYYSVSSRTQWNITKDFYVGLEGYYGHVNTMAKGQVTNFTALAGGAQPGGARTFADQNVFIYRMRVHRDLVP